MALLFRAARAGRTLALVSVDQPTETGPAWGILLDGIAIASGPRVADGVALTAWLLAGMTDTLTLDQVRVEQAVYRQATGQILSTLASALQPFHMLYDPATMADWADAAALYSLGPHVLQVGAVRQAWRVQQWLGQIQALPPCATALPPGPEVGRG